ncbi:flagellar motor protein MotA [Saccharobesus litoralis]|uniref:Flagellar motor protein MotA n=1 Tax=Saccharobesus litoralis TaxID=2172099 RepID=A0A2S0VLX8_9ALTE|nr:MotA/TolQ/ExbB proton channel family protein [Saccharobesus litoralis]AWB65199.1 flagellar motor protein MotA [Saccharobesus litoralis]
MDSLINYGVILAGLHQLVNWLLYPVIFALIIALVITVWELGLAIAERQFTLPAFLHAFKQHSNVEVLGQPKSLSERFTLHATKRLERVDLLARTGPILGLMGTLIPLGPGLSALSNGDISILATALTVAFDTTVVGLLVGLVAYILGRVRRRWYEQTWHAIQPIQSKDKVS